VVEKNLKGLKDHYQRGGGRDVTHKWKSRKKRGKVIENLRNQR